MGYWMVLSLQSASCVRGERMCLGTAYWGLWWSQHQNNPRKPFDSGFTLVFWSRSVAKAKEAYNGFLSSAQQLVAQALIDLWQHWQHCGFLMDWMDWILRDLWEIGLLYTWALLISTQYTVYSIQQYLDYILYLCIPSGNPCTVTAFLLSCSTTGLIRR